MEFIKFIAAELVLAIEMMQKHHIVHRDLKPDNIMLDVKYHAKIGDFGEAKIIKNASGPVL